MDIIFQKKIKVNTDNFLRFINLIIIIQNLMVIFIILPIFYSYLNLPTFRNLVEIS